MASPTKNKKITTPKKSPKLVRIIESRWFARQYAAISLVVLLGTTTVWSLLSAQLQQNNSDQLVNSFLFESSQTFHGATLPAAHSFLLKWPIFWLNHAFGNSDHGLVVFTILVTLATVTILAGALYWIERRGLVFGTLCLALASSLLLVPALAPGNGLLPVNMAMLATRNLEYAVYLGVLVLLVKSVGLKSRTYWLAVIFLSLLIADDKLFLTLSAGGALIALIVYALAGRWNYVKISVNWLLASLLAGILGSVWLAVVNGLKITHIAGQASASPYSLVQSAHNLLLAIAYAILDLLSIFGANPVFDNSVFRQIPSHLPGRLFGLGGLGFVCNLLIVALAGLAIWRLLSSSLKKTTASSKPDRPLELSLMLAWSSLAAAGAFVVTNHYYSADARYLTIWIFAGFIVMATYARRYKTNARLRYLPAIGLVFGVAITSSLFFVSRTYSSDKSAFTDLNQRNQLVAEAVSRHPVGSLVGDYWRVLPIKQLDRGKLKVSPLDSCFTQRSTLSSSTWRANLKGHSFAYLLTLDGSLTNFKSCSLNDVIGQYGRPNSSVLVAGSYSRPKELLLFYDRGAHQNSNKQPLTKTPATVLPISLDELPYVSCPVPTIMNVVAHEDDDLLFMNPDLMHNISAGHCIRSVYVTAGDAGGGQLYWLSRQQGSEAAYSQMAGTQDVWIERIVKLNDHEYITVANPRSNSKISLIFMHLPDGNLKGQGFDATGNQTLANLASGSLANIKAVDGQSNYSSSDLTGALTSLMHLYQPAEIHTQSTYVGTDKTHDHSDHNTVGKLTTKAYNDYEQQQFEDKVMVPIKYYMGYTVRDLPANVSGDDLQAKTSVFLTYGQHDGGVCHSVSQCRTDPAYGFYLPRQYQNNN